MFSGYISFFSDLLGLSIIFWVLSGLLLGFLFYLTYDKDVEIFNIFWFLLFSVWVVLGFGLFI